MLVLEVVDNPFAGIFNSPVFWTMQIGLLSLFSIYSIYICYKLYFSVKNKLALILPISLVLELISNIMRLVYWVDPMGSRTIIPLTVERVLFSLSYAPSLLGQLLISLYWLDTLRVSTVEVKVLLSTKSLAIFGVLGVVLFTLSILVVAPVTPVFRYLFNIAFEIAVLALMIFYIYIVIRLGCFSSEMLASQKHKRKRVYRTLVWYSLSALFCLGFLIVSPVFALQRTPIGKTLFYFLTMILLFAMSFCKVFPVSTKPPPTSRSSKSKSQHSKTKSTKKAETSSSSKK